MPFLAVCVSNSLARCFAVSSASAALPFCYIVGLAAPIVFSFWYNDSSKHEMNVLCIAACMPLGSLPIPLSLYSSISLPFSFPSSLFLLLARFVIYIPVVYIAKGLFFSFSRLPVLNVTLPRYIVSHVDSPFPYNNRRGGEFHFLVLFFLSPLVT